MVTIYTIQTGFTLVSPAVPDRQARAGRFAYAGVFQRRSERIRVPVKAFLVKVGERKVLVDTGWSGKCVTAPIRHMGFGLWFASEPVLEDHESAVRQLEALGVRPADLDAVVLTHLDCDHASGLCDLKDATHVFVSEEELSQAEKPNMRYHKTFWKGVHLESLAMKNDQSAPFGASCDLFGDGCVEVVSTPGHTAGSVAVVVKGCGKFAVLCGDDGYNAHSWDALALPGPSYDDASLTKTLAWVKSMRDDPRCVGVYAAHDTEMPVTPVSFP